MNKSGNFRAFFALAAAGLCLALGQLLHRSSSAQLSAQDAGPFALGTDGGSLFLQPLPDAGSPLPAPMDAGRPQIPSPPLIPTLDAGFPASAFSQR